MLNMKKLISLYISFLKIGAFTIGGGQAMIPLIHREAVDVKQWASDEEMSDFITVGQSLPGVVGINTATAVGNKAAGVAGAVAATLGMITPSLVIIILIAAFFDKFAEIAAVQRAFTAARAVVVALIFAATLRLAKSSVKDVFQYVLMFAAIVCILFLKISPVYIIIASGIISLIYGLIITRKRL